MVATPDSPDAGLARWASADVVNGSCALHLHVVLTAGSGGHMVTLSTPEIVDCSHEEVFQPRLAAMSVDWKGEGTAQQHRRWILPEEFTVTGPAPIRFGIYVQRHGLDRYAVRLIWDRTHLAWGALTRQQLLESCLPTLLAAIGTDFQYLL